MDQYSHLDGSRPCSPRHQNTCLGSFLTGKETAMNLYQTPRQHGGKGGGGLNITQTKGKRCLYIIYIIYSMVVSLLASRLDLPCFFLSPFDCSSSILFNNLFQPSPGVRTVVTGGEMRCPSLRYDHVSALSF